MRQGQCRRHDEERNETLNRAAFKIGCSWWPPANWNRADAVGGLLQAASSCGLGGAEAVRTVNSGMRAGARQPARDERDDEGASRPLRLLGRLAIGKVVADPAATFGL